MGGGNRVGEWMGKGIQGDLGSGVGRDRRDGQMAVRMNGNLQLMWVRRCGATPGQDRELGLVRCPRIDENDLSCDIGDGDSHPVARQKAQ